MKWRYLKINGSLIWGTNNLYREDLINCKQGVYDTIIDLLNNTQFDPENNEWLDLEGDK